MKKVTAMFAGVFLFSTVLLAQTYIDVSPGVGTLNDAITAHQGNVIYRLQANGFYTLNAQIENNGFTLTIVGTTPAAGQMPAAIQAATNGDGTVLNDMFNVVGNLTMRDIFIINANTQNTMGTGGVFHVTSSSAVRIVLDSLTVDPIGGNHFIVFDPAPHSKLFVTNSLLMRHGTLAGANDWCLFDLAGPANNGFDTLYLENNTFLSTGTHIGIDRNDAKNVDSNGFVWVNHNTFAFHKFQLLTAINMYKGYFVTNNLFFDFSTCPYELAWSAYGADGLVNKYSPNVYQDTVSADTVDGQLMSSRKLFAEFNSEYVDPRIEAYITTLQSTITLNDTGHVPESVLSPAYEMRLFYPADSAGVNREAGMEHSAQFPYMHAGNYMRDVDPQWSNPKMYQIQDSIVNWALPAGYELNAWGWSPSVAAVPANSGNWWWCDDSVYNLGNPVVWPRFSGGVYTNNATLHGSSEGLPLGNLNYFPTQLALWQKNQTLAMQNILNEDTTQFSLTGVKEASNLVPAQFVLSQNYPNPFNPSTQIAYTLPSKIQVSLKIYNVLGQVVSTLADGIQDAGQHVATFNADKLASGVYFYRLDAGNYTSVKKMMLLK